MDVCLSVCLSVCSYVCLSLCLASWRWQARFHVVHYVTQPNPPLEAENDAAAKNTHLLGTIELWLHERERERERISIWYCLRGYIRNVIWDNSPMLLSILLLLLLHLFPHLPSLLLHTIYFYFPFSMFVIQFTFILLPFLPVLDSSSSLSFNIWIK